MFAVLVTVYVMMAAAIVVVLLMMRRGKAVLRDSDKSKETGKAIDRQPVKLPSTQEFIGIRDIRHRMLELANGEYRAALEIKGVNFDLLSEKEQEILYLTYRGLLHALTFPISIYVQNRPLNLRTRIEHLREVAGKQPTELLQTYAGYLAENLEAVSLQYAGRSKRFFVVVHYSPRERFALARGSKEEEREQAIQELTQRVQLLFKEFRNMGLNPVVLETADLTEALLSGYMPEMLNTASVEDLEDNDALSLYTEAWQEEAEA